MKLMSGFFYGLKGYIEYFSQQRLDIQNSFNEK